MLLLMREIKKKVVFFDYWTKGIHNFVPLYEVLRKDGVTCQLLHLGSWRDSSIPASLVINDIECIDIVEYGEDIRRGIRSLDPSVVVMLNTILTVDRTINRICRSLGIKTIYLMHGIKAVGVDLDEVVRHQNMHWTLKKRMAKIPKYVSLVTNYLREIALDNPLELLAPTTKKQNTQQTKTPKTTQEKPRPQKEKKSDLAL